MSCQVLSKVLGISAAGLSAHIPVARLSFPTLQLPHLCLQLGENLFLCLHFLACLHVAFVVCPPESDPHCGRYWSSFCCLSFGSPL